MFLGPLQVFCLQVFFTENYICIMAKLSLAVVPSLATGGCGGVCGGVNGGACVLDCSVRVMDV